MKKDNHYWRICKNNIHAGLITSCDTSRFDKFKIKIHPPKKDGKHILVCPSSVGIHRYLNHTTWLDDTIEKIKKHTDRPIKIRLKPRGRGTSSSSRRRSRRPRKAALVPRLSGLTESPFAFWGSPDFERAVPF